MDTQRPLSADTTQHRVAASAARARVREVCCIIADDIQPVANLRVLKHVVSLVDGGAAEKEAAKAAWAVTR